MPPVPPRVTTIEAAFAPSEPVTQGRVWAAARAHRQALLRMDAETAQSMLAAYTEARDRLVDMHNQIQDAVDDRVAFGLKVTKEQKLEMWRLARIRQQVDDEIRRFARRAGVIVIDAQRRAVALAEAHVQQYGLAPQSDVLGGVAISSAQLPADVLETLVGTTGNGSPVAELFDSIAKESGTAVSRSLFAGVAAGLPMRDVRQMIMQKANVSRDRAMLIARTETLRAYREATHQRFEEADDVVTGWIWLAGLGSRCCAACVAKHGSKHKMDERLHSHPACRCVAAPIVDEADIDIVPGPEWFAGQDAETQAHVLGSNAAVRAYRAGAAPLEKFVGYHESEAWGRSMYAKSLKGAIGAEKAQEYYKPAASAKAPVARQLSEADAYPSRSVERATAEVSVLNDSVRRITGKTGTWNGKVVMPDGMYPLGTMEFDGTMRLNPKHAHRYSRYGTEVHELFHSTSAGYTPDAYIKAKFIEEGVVEGMTRAHLKDIMRDVGAPDIDVPRKSYQEEVDALEAFRAHTGHDDKTFYGRLHSTPLDRRKQELVRMVSGKVPDDLKAGMAHNLYILGMEGMAI